MNVLPTWFVKEPTRHVEDGCSAREEVARQMGRINAAICAHRYKTSNGTVESCDDCGKSLMRMALRRRTGKTARKRKEDRDERAERA